MCVSKFEKVHDGFVFEGKAGLQSNFDVIGVSDDDMRTIQKNVMEYVWDIERDGLKKSKVQSGESAIAGIGAFAMEEIQKRNVFTPILKIRMPT